MPLPLLQTLGLSSMALALIQVLYVADTSLRCLRPNYAEQRTERFRREPSIALFTPFKEQSRRSSSSLPITPRAALPSTLL